MKAAHILQQVFQAEDYQFVIELYRGLLGREPDPQGLYHHIHLLRSGTSKMAILIGIIQSEEAMSYLVPPAPPKDYYPTARSCLAAYSSDPNFFQENYKSFQFEDAKHHFEPKGFDPATRQLILNHLNTESPQPFVAAIPDGRVWGRSGGLVDSAACISRDNKVIWDVSNEFRHDPKTHPVFAQTAMPPVTYISETVAVLTSPGCFNYYHWMFEVLPRIELLRRSGIQIDKYVINRQARLPFQDETLAIVEIPQEKIIEFSGQSHLQAKKMVVSSFPGRQGHISTWASDFLRHHFLYKRGVQRKKGYERIYLSRSKARYRNVLNETEVTRLLEAYGFKILDLETLSVAEQAEIFYSAEAVVAPHGAALTNIVFCHPGTKVIEIFPAHYRFPCFSVLCQYYQFDYYYLIGQGYPRANHEWGLLAEDMTISPNELEQMLRFAGII